MFDVLLVLWLSVLCVTFAPKVFSYARSRWFNIDASELFFGHLEEEEPQEPEIAIVHMFGGPLEGEVHEIRADTLPHYFVTPHMPKDEDGHPIITEENVVAGPNGMSFVKPAIAFYTQMTDNEYLFVRDITEAELNKLRMTGELPKFQAS